MQNEKANNILPNLLSKPVYNILIDENGQEYIGLPVTKASLVLDVDNVPITVKISELEESVKNLKNPGTDLNPGFGRLFLTGDASSIDFNDATEGAIDTKVYGVTLIGNCEDSLNNMELKNKLSILNYINNNNSEVMNQLAEDGIIFNYTEGEETVNKGIQLFLPNSTNTNEHEDGYLKFRKFSRLTNAWDSWHTIIDSYNITKFALGKSDKAKDSSKLEGLSPCTNTKTKGTVAVIDDMGILYLSDNISFRKQSSDGDFFEPTNQISIDGGNVLNFLVAGDVKFKSLNEAKELRILLESDESNNYFELNYGYNTEKKLSLTYFPNTNKNKIEFLPLKQWINFKDNQLLFDKSVVIGSQINGGRACDDGNIVIGTAGVNLDSDDIYRYSDRNVLIGVGVMNKTRQNVDETLSVKNNIAIGYNAAADYFGEKASHSGGNVFLGSYAGYTLKSVDMSIYIGYHAGVANSTNHQTYYRQSIFIGHRSGVAKEWTLPAEARNVIAIGAGALCDGQGQFQLGNSEVKPYAYAALQVRSDRRDKTDIRNTILGLDFLLKHRPVEFRWDLRDDYYIDSEEGENRIPIPKDGSKKRKRFHEGFIAQEVKEVMDEMGVDFAGYDDHSVNGGADVLSIGYEEYIPVIVKAIQELNEKIEMLKTRL